MPDETKESAAPSLGSGKFRRLRLSDEDRAAMRLEIHDLARRQADDFPRHLEAIKAIIQETYPPHLLALLACNALTVGVSETGVSQNSAIPSIQQHHVEMLQALALSQSDWGTAPASPDTVQRLIDALTGLADAFCQRRIGEVSSRGSQQERAIVMLQERMRQQTQIVRNWGYFDVVLEVATELYKPLDEIFKENLGFRATEMIAVIRRLVAIMERRISEHFRKLKDVFRKCTTKDTIQEFFAQFPETKGNVEEFISHREAVAIEEIRAELWQHSTRLLVPLCIVPISELASVSDVDAKYVFHMLAELAFVRDELVGETVEHFFMQNPVWKKPFLLESDGLFCVIPQAYFSHIHSIMWDLAIRCDAEKSIVDVKSKYLESKVREILAKVIPKADLKPAREWYWRGERFESDVLAILDRCLFIFEAKSNTIPDPARRGAPARLQHEVRDLIVKPSKQSWRLEQIVRAAKQADAEAQAVADSLEIQAAQIDEIIRVSVTLEDFSVIATAEGELQAAGWLDGSIPLAPTINLADLMCIAEILDEPVTFAHYLSERAKLHKRADVFGNELDHLGFYLATAFRIPDSATTCSLMISGQSAEVDAYFCGKAEGLSVPKPRVALAEYTRATIAKLERLGSAGWFNVAIEVLRTIDLDAQDDLVEAMENLKSNVASNLLDPGHVNSFQFIPVDMERPVLIFHVYSKTMGVQSREDAWRLAASALTETGMGRCIVFSRMIEDWEDPFKSVLLASPDMIQ